MLADPPSFHNDRAEDNERNAKTIETHLGQQNPLAENGGRENLLGNVIPA